MTAARVRKSTTVIIISDSKTWYPDSCNTVRTIVIAITSKNILDKFINK